MSVSVPFLRIFKQKGKSSVAQTGDRDGEGGGSTESIALPTIKRPEREDSTESLVPPTIRRPEGEGSLVRAASVNTAEMAEEVVEAVEAVEATEAIDHVL